MRFQKTDLSLGTIVAATFSNLKILVKINRKHLIPKLALVSAAVCAVMLAFSPNANAITNLAFNDQYNVGSFKFGMSNPADPGSVATYVNYMITLNPGQSGTFSGMPFIRSNNVFANLPNADSNIIATGTNNMGIDLGAGGVYTYLFAKYDGKNDYSQVWYVGNLSGIINIPLNGPLGHALSGWILFGPGTPGVPDGGTTVMLLGAALGALGIARRYIMS
jgi:hypothetical protein